MFTKLVRIGRDAEMKYLSTGTAILEVSVVYDIGFGDKKSSQWVKLAMFGERAEKLVTHFTKGKQIVVSMDDVKSEAWLSGGEAKGGLAAKIVDFSFVSGGSQQSSPQQQAPKPQQAPQMSPAYQQAPPVQLTPDEQSWLSAVKANPAMLNEILDPALRNKIQSLL